MNEAFVVSLANGSAFTARADETVLAAAQRAQWMIRYGCRNGNCEVCRARLLQGSVIQRGALQMAHERQTILLCQCHAASDLALELDRDPSPGSADFSRRFYARFAGATPVAAGAMLEFLLPAGRKPQLFAAQIAVVETPAGDLQLAIDEQTSTARKLMLRAAADIGLHVGGYYYLRYPFGPGTDT